MDVQSIKVCAAVMMCNGWSCSFSLLLQCFHFQSPQHLHIPLLSLQMKDRTQRGARSPGQLTNHIHPRGAASQVQYIHMNFFSFLLSDSCYWFMPNSPTSSKRRIMPSDGGFSLFCSMLHCFECLDKVEKKCLCSIPVICTKLALGRFHDLTAQHNVDHKTEWVLWWHYRATYPSELRSN